MTRTPDRRLLPFTSKLHALGFERESRSDRDPLVYVRTCDVGRPVDAGAVHRAHPRVEVVVELWRDGRHRASHSYFEGPDLTWRHMDTHPTAFSTVGEMVLAIKFEFARRYGL